MLEQDSWFSQESELQVHLSSGVAVARALPAFFSVENAANYSSSALCKLFTCDKDMSLSFLANDGNVNFMMYNSLGFQTAVFSCEPQDNSKI